MGDLAHSCKDALPERVAQLVRQAILRSESALQTPADLERAAADLQALFPRDQGLNGTARDALARVGLAAVLALAESLRASGVDSAGDGSAAPGRPRTRR